ncbi:hypothetical protein AMECASPLE_024785 [Ameca splendens]|uniref:Uncharacterized protein n=1 Tax=Ameca splendens TaxID=208324 RepID=A0ABV1ACF0_9TELE
MVSTSVLVIVRVSSASRFSIPAHFHQRAFHQATSCGGKHGDLAHTKQTNLAPMNNQIGLEALKSLKSIQEAMVSPRILQSNSKRMHKISSVLIPKHGMVI